jgi:phage/plasmid-associated DNA primase
MLAGEIQGIALKSLKYLRHVIEHGFKRDGEVADGLEEFAMSVDQVRLWIDECCETTPLSLVGQPHRVPRTELYKSYRAWGQESGIGILKAHEFYNRLESAGFKAAKVGGVRYHEGIKVVVLAMSANSYDKSSPDSGDTIVDRWSTTG